MTSHIASLLATYHYHAYCISSLSRCHLPQTTSPMGSRATDTLSASIAATAASTAAYDTASHYPNRQ